MAQLITVRLARNDSSSPWGFRLQGGQDFGTPLLIQKVNGGSIAEKSGLRVGDALVRVNGQDVYDARHKEAQDAIVAAANNVELALQRGGHATWKPSVTPIGGATPQPNCRLAGTPSPVTKTSLVANHRFSSGTPRNNFAAKPFSQYHSNGGHLNENGSVKAIVNTQYNTPVGIYSDESIAETLSAQAEVLVGGVLGVNFKKNEKDYNPEKSEVLKMVQLADREPKTPEPDYYHQCNPNHRNERNHHQSNIAGGHEGQISGFTHVSAPVSKSPTNLSPGQNICADCERLIVGVFVRIKDKNLHVECFKCATCGTSLKNVGYYTINEKLYCDIHAKMVARQNPPAPNLQPLTALPTENKPYLNGNRTSTMSPSSNASMSPHTFTPVPFHAARPGGAQMPTPNQNFAKPSTLSPNFNAQNSVYSAPKPGGNGGGKGRSSAGVTAPRRGKGVLNQQNHAPGARIPLCASCNAQVRGPFITAMGKIWCPDHFVCVNNKCNRSLQDIGFVEEPSGLYCEYCYEQFLAPSCAKCSTKIKGDCLNAIGKQFHPECFNCAYCGKLFANNPFFLEDGLAYCENDWNELFTTKCFACGFPIEAGDRWVEALNNNYHSPCFNCAMCKSNLEGQSFYAKGGRPYCKNHGR